MLRSSLAFGDTHMSARGNRKLVLLSNIVLRTGGGRARSHAGDIGGGVWKEHGEGGATGGGGRREGPETQVGAQERLRGTSQRRFGCWGCKKQPVVGGRQNNPLLCSNSLKESVKCD